MRKLLLLAVFSIIILPVGQAGAAAIEDGAEICTPKQGCKMLLNILPKPISSIKNKKQCKVTWAVRPERPWGPWDLFSATEPLPKNKKDCKVYLTQNLGRWEKEHRGSGPAPWPPQVFLEPIPIKFDVWR
ncbi:MAG: hypothetical protein VST70_05320 [Nitrospirota bacterium]|nr:hypothetical protein [Nitrospirota bacterium]